MHLFEKLTHLLDLKETHCMLSGSNIDVNMTKIPQAPLTDQQVTLCDSGLWSTTV